MKKFIFLGIIFLFSQMVSGYIYADSQVAISQPEPLKKLIKEIAHYNVYEYILPNSKVISAQNSRYESLLRLADTDELIQLSSHKNAVVRLYAYQAIVKQFSVIPPQILEKFSTDETLVNTLRGDVKEKVAIKKIAAGFLY